jgi:hypothetical protein
VRDEIHSVARQQDSSEVIANFLRSVLRQLKVSVMFLGFIESAQLRFSGNGRSYNRLAMINDAVVKPAISSS